MLRQVLWKALWATPIVWAVEETLISVQVVRGQSMSPTLHDGDVLLINKFATLCLRPVLCLSYPLRVARGDVVTLWSPYDPNTMLIKRIVAMQGDWLHVPHRTDFVRLKKGQVWLEGDAQGPALTSEDSKTWGPVPMALVQGKAEAVLWPPARIGWVQQVPVPARVVKMNDASLGDA